MFDTFAQCLGDLKSLHGATTARQRRPDQRREEALEFDGTRTDQLDDTYRLRVVTASESESGTVSFDDRGHSHWKWKTELAPSAGDITSTFNHLTALENPALNIEGEATPEPPPSTKTGYDPYATGVVAKPKIGR